MKSITLSGIAQSILIFWGTYEICSVFKLTLPSSGLSIFKINLPVVVFPDPFGPINVTISFLFIYNETPLTNHLLSLKTPALFNFTNGFFFIILFLLLST